MDWSIITQYSLKQFYLNFLWEIILKIKISQCYLKIGKQIHK